MNKIGRPKQPKQLVELSFTSFQEQITMFKNGLYDYLDQEEDKNLVLQKKIEKFLAMQDWEQNIFIIYILTKNGKFTFKSLAQLLQVEKAEMMREIKRIKNYLTEI